MAMRLRSYDEETGMFSADLQTLEGDIASLTKTAQHPIGISLFTDSSRTEYKSTYQILKEISEIYDELTDKQQAELLEKLAGKRQGQVVAAILNNFEAVENSLETMSNSAGNAEAEMAIITDSIEYKLNRLKETGVAIGQTLFQRDSTKDTIDRLTSILEVINKLTDAVGGLGMAFAAIMGSKGFKSGFKGGNYFTGGINGIKNFFTQKQLSDEAITLGITQNDIKLLSDYDKQLRINAQDTAALGATYQQMTPGAQSFATQMQAGTASMKSLTVATKAAQLGLKALNAALNIGISLLVSYGISKLIQTFDDLIETEEEAKQKHEELMQSINNNIEQHKKEQKELAALIKEYESYEDYTTYTAEEKERLKEIQDQLIETYGYEANGIDLVNGKYDEQIQKLKELEKERDKANNANYWALYDEAKKDYENNSGFSWKNSYTWANKDQTINATNAISPLQQALNGVLGIESYTDSYGIGGKNYTREVTYALKVVDENGNPLNSQQMLDQVLAIQDRLNEIRLDPSVEMQAVAASQDFLELQTQVADWVAYYSKEAQAYEKTLSDLAKSVANTQDVVIDGQIYNVDNVTPEVYQEFKKKLIDSWKTTDPELAEAIREYLNNTFTEAAYQTPFDRYWNSKLETDAKNLAKQHAKINEEELTFDINDYAESIEDTSKAVTSLASAYKQISDGEISTSEMLTLFKKYPQLAQYAEDTDLLAQKIRELAMTEVTPLIKELIILRDTIKDPEQKSQIDGLVNSLYRLGSLSDSIDKTAKSVKEVKVSDYLKYEEKQIDHIIDKLEAEKDAQNEILDNLKAQKEELESIIDEYEKTASIVGKYIDKTQIKPLEDRKTEIEEYYNTEIEKLKEENEERDRNIDLQEKQAALANARKTKVRNYDETGGWGYTQDINAIQKAEKELKDLENEIAIDTLEKQRDEEVKGIEEQIEAWENYKDEWQKQVDAITEADEELIASKVLGVEWHEKVANKDVSIMVDYGSRYAAYNDRLKNQVNIEIANMEKAIKARDKEIDKWKQYKTELSNLNDDIADENAEYLKELSTFVNDEDMIWKDRLKKIKANVEELNRLNGKATETPSTTVSSSEESTSGLYALVYDGKDMAIYRSQSDAEKGKRRIAEQIAKERSKSSSLPAGVLEAMIASIIETIKVEKRYAKGGINTATGLAWLDGTGTSSEVVFNSKQAKELYDIVRSGEFGNSVMNNIISSLKSYLGQLKGANQHNNNTSTITISFPNAHIDATDYDSFKGFMDRYTTDLLTKMQVGL